MPSDDGNQIVTLKFYDSVDTPNVNARHRTIRPTGIYSGGYLKKKNNGEVYISALVCEILDKDGSGNQVRVETEASGAGSVEEVVTITGVAEAAPVIVLRWIYSGVAADDYMDFLAVSSAESTDLIVGEVDYSGAEMQEEFDYSNRSNPNKHDYFLKVEPEQISSLYVRIRAGYVQVGNQAVQIPDQISDVFVPPTSGSATGAVYVDGDGNVQVSSDYSYGDGDIVLAEIALAAGQTQITAANITDVRPFLSAPAIPDDVTIDRDSNGKFEIKDISSLFSPTAVIGGTISITLPNGLILKFGSTTASLRGGGTAIFPVPFPNNCFVAIPVYGSVVGDTVNPLGAFGFTKFSFQLDSFDNPGKIVYYVAIGY